MLANMINIINSMVTHLRLLPPCSSCTSLLLKTGVLVGILNALWDYCTTYRLVERYETVKEEQMGSSTSPPMFKVKVIHTDAGKMSNLF